MEKRLFHMIYMINSLLKFSDICRIKFLLLAIFVYIMCNLAD